jgi:hypothetical protein
LGLSQLVEAGAVAADDDGAPRRAALLRQAASEGPTLLSRDAVRDALLAAAGPLARGALTPKDLEDARAVDRPAASDAVEGASIVTVAADVASGAGGRVSKALSAIVAIDPQGVAACLLADLGPSGVAVDEFQISLPACGHPVRRGIPRTRPGEVLPMPASLAIVERDEVRVALAAVIGDLPLEDLVALAADPTIDTGLARFAARGGTLSVLHDVRGARVALGEAR